MHEINKILSRNTENIKRRHKMSKILKELTQFLAKQPSALEAFINSKNPQTHADVEFWSKYWEFRGL